MIFSSVDLPEPFRPSTPILAPGKKDSEMSFRICRFGGTILPTRFMVKTYWAMGVFSGIVESARPPAARNPLLSPLGGTALTRSHDTAPASQRPTVREAVFGLLRDLGLTTIFGNPGSTELPMFLDFPADFRYVLGLQESVVVGMADGYAQATRNAAFVNLHSAVGVGHAMGAIFTAYKNRTPMVITAGQQARSILPFDPFLSSARATELPRPYVKWAVEPARAEDVPLAIARAYYLAMMPPRGPVLVSVPADDWAHAEPNTWRRDASASRCAPTRRCWPRSARRSTPPSARPSSSARRSTATAPGTRRCNWPRRHKARVFHRADVRPLRLPRRPCTVRRLPAPDARAHRRSSWPATTWCW